MYFGGKPFYLALIQEVNGSKQIPSFIESTKVASQVARGWRPQFNPSFSLYNHQFQCFKNSQSCFLYIFYFILFYFISFYLLNFYLVFLFWFDFFFPLVLFFFSLFYFYYPWKEKILCLRKLRKNFMYTGWDQGQHGVSESIEVPTPTHVHFKGASAPIQTTHLFACRGV